MLNVKILNEFFALSQATQKPTLDKKYKTLQQFFSPLNSSEIKFPWIKKKDWI